MGHAAGTPEGLAHLKHPTLSGCETGAAGSRGTRPALRENNVYGAHPHHRTLECGVKRTVIIALIQLSTLAAR